MCESELLFIYIVGSINYFSDWAPSALCEAQLVAILQFCQLWMIDAGVAFAIHSLDGLGLCPSRMLELGRQFSIVQWIGPAVAALLQTPLRDISKEAVEQVGLIAFETIARAKDALESERKLMAAIPPPLPQAASCHGHNRCQKIWVDMWFKTIGRELLHPSKPLPFDKIISRTLELIYNGLSMDCKGDAIIQMITSSSFQIEEAITQSATARIISRYGLNNVHSLSISCHIKVTHVR
jgi:hypothetical protein